MLQTVSILITGKVQGVYYRQSTKEKARELGVTGFVKNLPDGSVQVIATGTTGQLNSLAHWCKQGPARAKVDDVKMKEIPAQVFTGFTIQQ